MNSKISVFASALGYTYALSDHGKFALSQQNIEVISSEVVDLNHQDLEQSPNPGSEGKRNCQRQRGCGCSYDRCGLRYIEAKDNGCLCYEGTAGYGWFVPANEHGCCKDGALPVQTDHYTIYDIIAKWNIEGTERNRAQFITTIPGRTTTQLLSSSTGQGI